MNSDILKLISEGIDVIAPLLWTTLAFVAAYRDKPTQVALWMGFLIAGAIGDLKREVRDAKAEFTQAFEVLREEP